MNYDRLFTNEVFQYEFSEFSVKLWLVKFIYARNEIVITGGIES